MEYVDMAGERVSRLGFGAMRLPLTADRAVDEGLVGDMVAYAAEQGVNYFDTAYPYHGGMSEIVLGHALAQLPRESFFLADKFPGHQIADTYDPADVFEEQLEKCGVDYFDFYLLHNVYERSLAVYEDPRWDIIGYFLEQKRLGRIRHLGFSAHALLPCLTEFLERHGHEMDFAQIQMNYVDWTVQSGAAKYDLLARHGLDAIVMEPLRGGKLADLGPTANARLQALRPDDSIASWALRWQLSTPAKVVLSGMSTMDQVVDNCATFSDPRPLSDAEAAALYEIAESMQESVPCTACRYCTDSCPQELDIPTLITLANDARVAPSFNVGMMLEALPPERRPDACIGCRCCEAMCPQNIAIADVLADLVERQSSVPSWDALCRQRAEAARALRASRQ